LRHRRSNNSIELTEIKIDRQKNRQSSIKYYQLLIAVGITAINRNIQIQKQKIVLILNTQNKNNETQVK